LHRTCPIKHLREVNEATKLESLFHVSARSSLPFPVRLMLIYRIENAFAGGRRGCKGVSHSPPRRRPANGLQAGRTHPLSSYSWLSGQSRWFAGSRCFSLLLSLCVWCVCALRFNSRFDSRPAGTYLSPRERLIGLLGPVGHLNQYAAHFHTH
jgi:hypothetical protein